MYSEIGFIFNPILSSSLSTVTNLDNTGNIYGRPIRIAPTKPDQNTSEGQPTQVNQGQSGQNPTPNSSTGADEGMLVYKRKDVFGTDGIKNYLKNNVYYNDGETNGDEDPYISLIQYFGKKETKALKLRAADFAYLKDLGVYPVNRLWILRRFPDNAIVPNNLLEWGKGVEAVSTIVGWMKDQENNPMISLTFNEVWVDQTEMIDKVFSQILKDEFGLKLPAMMSVPGWSQGILFGMLKAMKLTDDFDSKNPPTGNPNILRIAKMRDIANQALQSRLNMTLETCYEQKYINGIDPGLAMMDILSNLFKMGTSDQKFILSNSPMLQEFVSNLNNNGANYEAWIPLMTKMVNAFVEGVTNFIDEMKKTSTADVTGTEGSSTGTADDQKAKTDSFQTAIPDANTINSMGSFLKGVANSLLAGTISKYRWPLKGSIGMMSGINTTPWHLTIGNPYSPIINIGNIVVGSVDVKLSNELGFNDMPARIDVAVNVEFGRPLGKQELEKMFNNGYKRVYSKKALTSPSDTPEISSNTTASGLPAPYNGTVSNENKSWYDPGLDGTQQNYYRSGSEIPANATASIAP
jgi:hypothetical protein